MNSSFDSLSNDLLSYVLSFSFKDYAQISRVSRRFRLITHQKGFWRCVGLYAFRHTIPKNILKEVDFFHGLEPNDPPFGWLGSLISDSFHILKTNIMYLVYYKNARTSETLRKTLSINLYSNYEYYSQKIFFSYRNFTFSSEKPIRITYFKHPFLRRRIINRGFTTYVEIWDETKQMTWSGEPGCDEERVIGDQLHLLLPKNDTFGFWIK